jgi:hypothetical protein
LKAALRRLGWFFILLFMAFAIGRGLVELFVINWSDPASYRADWGGPSLLGVLLVHSGPGILSAAILLMAWRRRRRHRGAMDS